MCIWEGRGQSKQYLNEIQGKDVYGEQLNSHNWKQKYFRELNMFTRTWKEISTYQVKDCTLLVLE